ncbi:hypothetical protein CBR_g29884 [Chara braunii]|uniref:Uncharacterized protein n=1 Tax=Chara braunii TaxID=69332 RepID=A0A388JWU8_CHABU|nr:hypothetical protein CBR_g29884 [Chara braunii]|eukprot:GBG62276.1 hypothetical protein CBR_g29884 [Chara braunii]
MIWESYRDWNMRLGILISDLLGSLICDSGGSCETATWDLKLRLPILSCDCGSYAAIWDLTRRPGILSCYLR